MKLLEGNYSKYIDPKIRTLVEMLNDAGIATGASCQGGLSHCTNYPWVHLPERNYSKLTRALNLFNKSSNLKWAIKKKQENCCYYLLPQQAIPILFKQPKAKFSGLKQYQKNANVLAKFINKNRAKLKMPI